MKKKPSNSDRSNWENWYLFYFLILQKLNHLLNKVYPMSLVFYPISIVCLINLKLNRRTIFSMVSFLNSLNLLSEIATSINWETERIIKKTRGIQEISTWLSLMGLKKPIRGQNIPISTSTKFMLFNYPSKPKILPIE